jgi:hypothetical protein
MVEGTHFLSAQIRLIDAPFLLLRTSCVCVAGNQVREIHLKITLKIIVPDCSPMSELWHTHFCQSRTTQTIRQRASLQRGALTYGRQCSLSLKCEDRIFVAVKGDICF